MEQERLKSLEHDLAKADYCHLGGWGDQPVDVLSDFQECIDTLKQHGVDTTIELFEACPYCKSLDISSLEGNYWCNGCDHAFMDVIWIDEEEHEWRKDLLTVIEDQVTNRVKVYVTKEKAK